MALLGNPRLKSVTRIINYKVLIVPQSIWIDDDLNLFYLKINLQYDIEHKISK